MAFKLPVFNITCDFFDALSPPPAVPRLTVLCQLRAAGKSSTGQDSQNIGWPFLWSIALPPRTDARDAATVSGADIVQVPSGTGRFYDVVLVDDVARDFLNEYRIAFVRKRGLWATPIA